MATIRTLDLSFFGVNGLISSFLAPAGDGFVLFDSGPASCVESVERRVREEGYDLAQLRAVFATHVHLDHAGGAGVLARKTGCRVFCHPEGANHLADPGAKLLPSAERLYGDMMVPLWGQTEGVSGDALTTVADADTVTIDGLEVTAWHTPGHAVHHVAWQVGDHVATGDVAGVRFPGSEHVLPPMPPPDINVEEWFRSLDQLRSLEPAAVMLTHFGAFTDCERHFDELEDRLRRWTAIAERVVGGGGDRDALGAELAELDEAEMQTAGVPPDVAERYRRLCPVKESSTGLFRYCSLKAGSQ